MVGFDTDGDFESVSGATTAYPGQIIASDTWNVINETYAEALTQVAQNQIIRTPVSLTSAGTSYTVAALDRYIFVKANTPNIVLPACASKLCPVTIMGAATGIFNTNATTLVPNGAETINGAANLVLGVAYQTINLVPMASGGYSADPSEVALGTVTSVGLGLPSSLFTVTNSPVTTSGTLTGSLLTQLPNLVWASNGAGSTATPTFRALVDADMPVVSVSKGGTGVSTLVAYALVIGGTISTSPAQTVPSVGTSGQILTSQGAGLPPQWVTAGGAIGTVTSVALGLPSALFTVTGSPVTTSGTIVGSLATQLPNLVWASDNAGATAVPSFRAIALADLPTITVPKGGTGNTTLLPYSIIVGGTISTSSAQTVPSLGTSGQVLTSQGASALPQWTTVSGSADTFATKLFQVQDQKAANTDGGTFTAGAWRTRVLNTSLTNEIAGASLASNQIILPAGTYFIEAQAPAFSTGSRHKAKLANITDTTDTLIGTSAYSSAASVGFSYSSITGRFTIAAQKTFEIQHQCETTIATTGFGVASNLGVVEVYTNVTIWKVA